jgi:DNA-binding Xre family transcriptional regulator
MNEFLKTLAEELKDKGYAHAYMSEQANMRIASQVRALRLQRGWTQQHLARASGMAQERISKIEAADFDSLTLSTLRKLAGAFDVHVMATFVQFSSAILDFVALSPEWLQCRSRDEDLAIFCTSFDATNLLSQTTAASISVAGGVHADEAMNIAYETRFTLTLAANTWSTSDSVYFDEWHMASKDVENITTQVLE